MKRLIGILFLVCFSAILCVAAVIGGRWSGKIGEHFDVTVTLKDSGGKLTGTILSELGEAPLTGGKIVGDAISFKEMSYKGISVSYVKGTLKGNKIDVVVGFQGQQMAGTLIRVK